MKKLNLYILSICLCIMGCQASPVVQDNTSKYPAFSWDKIPVCFHFAKRSSLLTEKEAAFVASHADLICLEKGHGVNQFGYTEDAIEQEAIQLKKYNPNIKVIFYWNTFLDYPLYRAHEVYEQHPEWWLKTLSGELDKKQGKIKRYDLSNSEVRTWWADVAEKAVKEGSCDGIFMDAFGQVSAPSNKVLWGEEKYKDIQAGLLDIIRETREKIGNDKLIVYNGIRTTRERKIGDDFKDYTDAVMLEHYGQFYSDSKECMLNDILELMKAGKNGRIIIFKGWPGFTWLDKEYMELPLKKKRELAAGNIIFPLASFLAGAQENSYFNYSWGYQMEDGALEWYPEFDLPLGKPLNDAKIDGWIITRDFEHLSIWLNLETKEAKIIPHP